AIATVSSYIFGLVYIRVKAWKVSGLGGNPRVVLHAVASMVMGLILWYLLGLTVISRWYHLIIMVMVGISIYFAILYMFKEFRKKDFEFFVDTLNIKKMFRYIEEELRYK
ncbi:MAG: polysaccharide biosynthesis C-terminal domain-containing protein, partial [Thermoplasmata archaeon]|nr:polysaccharide biosynthesis C-terminal domain-containing protein [Thermoplasmata archaeon]